MRFLNFVTVGAAALCLTLPVAANDRDSDGDVISVIYPKPLPVTQPVLVVDTRPIYTVTLNGENEFLEFRGPADVGATVDIRGETYRVEQTGANLVLRAGDSGERFNATRVAQTAPGLNPKGFGLE